MIAKKNYTQKAQMRKTLAMHEESTTRRKAGDNVQDGAVPAYLLDRERPNNGGRVSFFLKTFLCKNPINLLPSHMAISLFTTLPFLSPTTTKFISSQSTLSPLLSNPTTRHHFSIIPMNSSTATSSAASSSLMQHVPQQDSNEMERTANLTFQRYNSNSTKRSGKETSIVWFRNDLRVLDNEALYKSWLSSQTILPVYCVDPRLFATTYHFGFQKTGGISILRHIHILLCTVYAQKETCSEELNVERSVSRCLQVFVFRFVLSCGKDSTMKLWEVGTERLVKQYVGVVHTQLRFLADTRALKRKTWEQLASEEGKDIPKASEIERLMCRTGVDHVLNRLEKPMEGLEDWLEAVYNACIPCVVVSSLDRKNVVEALEQMRLNKYFQAIVTEEDGMESIARRFLSAAVKKEELLLRLLNMLGRDIGK